MIFPIFVGMMIQSDFHIFQRGRSTTKHWYFPMTKLVVHYIILGPIGGILLYPVISPFYPQLKHHFVDWCPFISEFFLGIPAINPINPGLRLEEHRLSFQAISVGKELLRHVSECGAWCWFFPRDLHILVIFQVTFARGLPSNGYFRRNKGGEVPALQRLLGVYKILKVTGLSIPDFWWKLWLPKIRL